MYSEQSVPTEKLLKIVCFVSLFFKSFGFFIIIPQKKMSFTKDGSRSIRLDVIACVHFTEVSRQTRYLSSNISLSHIIESILSRPENLGAKDVGLYLSG